ncbi:pollen-specific leucine-rich repeat extensin-like protein 3 [Iris pallida]|uniref:Pollen-specific leucine-rich repeat extensin-like protein 3 n=1 Tax=Iris pallida TaxID=29817 RepID=A0AAX6G3H9_IRIPA|nr:pollen-specific leucine-rich repeat extensin-like protein 3 [Iris pallida]
MNKVEKLGITMVVRQGALPPTAREQPQWRMVPHSMATMAQALENQIRATLDSLPASRDVIDARAQPWRKGSGHGESALAEGADAGQMLWLMVVRRDGGSRGKRRSTLCDTGRATRGLTMVRAPE